MRPSKDCWDGRFVVNEGEDREQFKFCFELCWSSTHYNESVDF